MGTLGIVQVCSCLTISGGEVKFLEVFVPIQLVSPSGSHTLRLFNCPILS